MILNKKIKLLKIVLFISFIGAFLCLGLSYKNLMSFMIISVIISTSFNSITFLELAFVKNILKSLDKEKESIDIYKEGTFYFLIPIFCFIPSLIFSILMNKAFSVLTYNLLFLEIFLYIQSSVFYFSTLLFFRASISFYNLNRNKRR